MKRIAFTIALLVILVPTAHAGVDFTRKGSSLEREAITEAEIEKRYYEIVRRRLQEGSKPWVGQGYAVNPRVLKRAAAALAAGGG